MVLLGTAIHTVTVRYVSVQFEHSFATGATMKVVDVLRGKCKIVDRLLHPRQGYVSAIWIHCLYQVPAIIVPFPHKPGIPNESIEIRKLFGSEFVPQPFRTSKCRHAAFGRDPRAGEDADRAQSLKNFQQLL
jgi:hypothetical protein